MPSRVEECLQKATDCEKKARDADEQDISSSFRRLTEHWRRLAKIVADKAGAATGQIAGEHLDSGSDQTMCKRPPARN
jgi:hypothetical protein